MTNTDRLWRRWVKAGDLDALGRPQAGTLQDAPHSYFMESATSIRGRAAYVQAPATLLPMLITAICAVSVTVIGTACGPKGTPPAPPAGEKALEAADPMSGSGVENLATPNALLIDENTNQPLAHAVCRVTDANGVTVIAQTDAEGRWMTDELLQRGRVQVSVMRPKERRVLQRLERPGRPNSYALPSPDLFAIDRHEKAYLLHRGDSAAPDRWRIGERRWVPVECAGLDPMGSSVELVLTTEDPEPTFEPRWPQAPQQQSQGQQGPKESLVDASNDAVALVFEAMQARFLRRTGREPLAAELPPWSRQRVDETEASKVVRGVQFLDEGVLVAEAHAAVVPFLYQAPIRLDFAPLAESDAQQILALYGQDLGQRILRHSLPEGPAIDRSGTITGTVTSESGQFHGQVDVMVTNFLLQIEKRGVTWKRDDSGRWVGTFEFDGLEDASAQITLSAGPNYRVEPPRADATPPHEFERGRFVVRDLVDPAAPDVNPKTPAASRR